MEFLRRPSVLAAAAAGLLVIAVMALVAGGDQQQVAVDDPLADGATGGDGAAATDGEASAGSGTEGGGDQQTTDEGAGGDDGGGEATTDGGGDEGEAAAGEADDGTAGGSAGIGLPVGGTYGYASGGSWSLSGSGEPEEYQLPATATASVEVDGDTWRLRLAAGERYADRFGFVLGPDSGLDWTDWVLERQFSSGDSETAYTCTSDSAYYRPDEQGRVISHDCESDAGIVSDGQVEHLGSEDVTLGDGTVISADRLLYTYSVSGSGTTQGGVDFEVTGEGRLDLWLDPATGLRVRELRSISTTTTFSTGGESVYQEDVEFTLQSSQPS